jgi:CxxC motif-containing protein (DUF1111 family)
MSARTWAVGWAVFIAVLAARTASIGSQVIAPNPPGGPLPGLTALEFSEFRMGLDDFLEVETPDEGLGPAFNGTSCGACHHSPSIGGGSAILEVRAGFLENGEFRGLDETGETLIHLFSIPTHGCQPQIPDESNVLARRAPIPLFGAGLVEAIPDDTLLALADADDRNRDGVSGKAGIVRDPETGDLRVGRFGWKAQHATLLAFGADAYRNEMGITNDLFPQELAVGVRDENMLRCDRVPDPEDIRDPRTRRRGIDNFASFMRFLAPAGRAPIDAAAVDGEAIFKVIGCASCHHPVLETGRSTNPLFDRRAVALFSDLLLHDVGTGDGIRQASATPDEIRTPALWGLRFRRPLMHDGRSTTVENAIQQHRGEADLARQGFERLSPSDKVKLLAFLKTL